MVKTMNYGKRLADIAGTVLGELSDEAVLHLLAERKQLQELQAEYDELKQAEGRLTQAENEKTAIDQELIRLNKLISPDKPDEELIHLIEERKVWEAKLVAVETTLAQLKSGAVVATVEEVLPTDTLERSVPTEPSEMTVEAPVAIVPEAMPAVESATNQDFGQEKITEVALDENSEFFPYLQELQGNESSLGRILERLPSNVKKDKLFMLEVAKIDPAYAMHYADKNALKRDEDFNIKVASIKNKHNSGSALSEMLPEARTAKVVMAAIRNDYRNVRFLLPQMAGYDDMLARAKSGALERVKGLKESADISLLIPKMLQKDKTFMKQVEDIMSK